MKIGIMQPYLFPYAGYYDLIRKVDKFVLYDDAKYIKGGWINRNNFPMPFTFRLKKHSDYAKINQLYFYDIEQDKKDFLRKTGLRAENYLSVMQQSYSVSYNIYLTTMKILGRLGCTTPIYFSSQFKHGKFVKGILDIVKELNGDTYVNLPGGKKLYNQSMFEDIKLEFIDTEPGPSILCNI
jgi:hypothetical protein